ncbi:MAG: hypothetical protein J3K34DRAFT_398673, partial [Monoraphidium minutum]
MHRRRCAAQRDANGSLGARARASRTAAACKEDPCHSGGLGRSEGNFGERQMRGPLAAPAEGQQSRGRIPGAAAWAPKGRPGVSRCGQARARTQAGREWLKQGSGTAAPSKAWGASCRTAAPAGGAAPRPSGLQAGSRARGGAPCGAGWGSPGGGGAP